MNRVDRAVNTTVIFIGHMQHYLTTGRKYVLIKKYALNKYVRLLTRLYGSTQECITILCM